MYVCPLTLVAVLVACLCLVSESLLPHSAAVERRVCLCVPSPYPPHHSHNRHDFVAHSNYKTGVTHIGWGTTDSPRIHQFSQTQTNRYEFSEEKTKILKRGGGGTKKSTNSFRDSYQFYFLVGNLGEAPKMS